MHHSMIPRRRRSGIPISQSLTGLVRLWAIMGANCETDLERHVLDSMAATSSNGDPSRQLEEALKRLGRPNDYLRPILGDLHISRATRTYSPVAVGRGLFHTILDGGGRVLAASLFSLGYLFIAVFVGMALSKPFWPDNVGLFLAPDGTISAGIVAHITGSQELLGWWTVPIALTLAALIYAVLTKGLARLICET